MNPAQTAATIEASRRILDAAPLRCQYTEDCKHEVTHIDRKGFIYCADHGFTRRASGTSCRKMTAAELKKIKSGKPLERY